MFLYTIYVDLTILCIVAYHQYITVGPTPPFAAVYIHILVSCQFIL